MNILPKVIQQEFCHELIKHSFLTKNIKDSTHKYVYKKDRDYFAEIENNLYRAGELFLEKKTKVNILQQVHGNNVIVADSDFDIDYPIAGDAIVTNKANVVIGVMTADCVPVLLADFENKVIAAVHCGWRSAFSDIIENTISQMRSLGAKNISSVIGPCIRKNNYEVDQCFYDRFLDSSIHNKQFFIHSSKNGHYLFDLPSFVKNKLQVSGIDDIFDCNLDTYDDERFFSFRRQKQKHQGSFLSLITIQ